MRNRVWLVPLLVMVGSSAAFGGQQTGLVTGTVHHDSVKRYPTVVYIDEISRREFTPPPANPIQEIKRKAFSPRVLPVLAGTTVEVANSDSRKHTISSPDGEKYDLETIAPGQRQTHTFNTPGVYAQSCSHHPDMVGYVVVLTTPYFALTDDNGAFRIANVPAGTWKLRLWNEGLGSGQLARSYEVTISGTDTAKVDIEFASLRTTDKFWLEPPPAADATQVERGAWLYRQQGCFLCHGESGGGGVRNRNYISGTVPALTSLAERLTLSEPEEVATVVAQLERGRDLERFADTPLTPRYEVFLAKYRDARDVVVKGRSPGKMHSRGPAPPLAMPSWKTLPNSDVDALFAYLLTLQRWSEKEP